MYELRKDYGHWEVIDHDKYGHPRYKWVWDDYAGYMRGLRDKSPRDYGMMLLRMEQRDFRKDRWWDVDGYREEAIREYRGRIKEIRQKWGVSKSEAEPFMRVA